MSRVTVTIDQILLSGFEPSARKTFVDGLKTELERVLADPAARRVLAYSRRTAVLRLGSLPLDSGQSGVRKLGRSVASASLKRFKS